MVNENQESDIEAGAGIEAGKVSMILIESRCNNCGRHFHGGYSPDGKTETTIKDSAGISIQCPFCESWVRIHEDTNKNVNHVLNFLKKKNPTKGEIRKLEAILKGAKEAGTSAELVAETIAKEIPEFSFLGNFLVEDFKKNPGQWANNLITLLTLLSTLAMGAYVYKYPPAPYKEPAQNNVEVKANIVKPKLRVNEKCPCGSGQKVKRCTCGKYDRRNLPPK